MWISMPADFHLARIPHEPFHMHILFTRLSHKSARMDFHLAGIPHEPYMLIILIPFTRLFI